MNFNRFKKNNYEIIILIIREKNKIKSQYIIILNTNEIN